MRFIRQTILAMAAAVAAGSAAAQSSVTLYGVVDVFGQYLNNGGTSSIMERSGGSAGSQVGLKGTEDLGGGLRAVFDLESGYTTNNGAFFVDPSAMFYRQAWLGLTHERYGTLSFGRQYQPTFWVLYYGDPFRGNEVLSPLSAAAIATDRNTLATQAGPGRLSNSVLYKSPNLNGFQLYAMYALAATSSYPVPTTLGNTLDVAAMYTGYGFYAGIAYQNEHQGTRTIPGLPGPLAMMSTDHYTGALAYRFGIVNLQFNYIYSRPQSAPAGSLAARLNAANSNSIAEAGMTIQATDADVIEFAAVQRKVRGVDNNTLAFELGADHSLSKRTTVYARAGYMKNHGTATMSWPGVSVTKPGTSQTLVGAGISHRF